MLVGLLGRKVILRRRDRCRCRLGQDSVGDGLNSRGRRKVRSFRFLNDRFLLGRQVFERWAVDVVGGRYHGVGFGRLFRGDADLRVQVEEILGGGAVDVEPPVAHEDFLLEQSAVGAQERRLVLVVANVEHLSMSEEKFKKSICMFVRLVNLNQANVSENADSKQSNLHIE